MASCRLGFLLLLLLTVHPGSSKAQHWSHGWYPGGKRASSSAQYPQHAPRLLASSPDQTAHNLPSDALAPPENSVPWEARTTGWWPLRRKQHLVKTLLPPAASKGVGGGVRGPRVPWCPAAASGSRDALRRAGRGGGLGHAARAASPGWGPPVWASGPAGAARAGPQDPPRPSGQVQGRARGDPAQGGSCRIVLADGALPAVPPDGVRPQAGVRVRGAEEGARGPVRGPGRAQGAARCYRAPRPDGLEPGGEPAAARAAVSETAAGGAGAGAAAGGGESSAGQRGAGLGAAQGAGSAAAAGGSKKFHHSREPGGTGGRSFGLAKELQLGHHQRWAGGQATAQGLLRAQ